MKRKMLSTIVLVCLAAAVQARLGDSFKQSITRFGKPLGHFKDKYAKAALFEYKNYAVFVRYRYDKSFEETYAYLAPRVKEQLKSKKKWTHCFGIINNPKNLEPLNEKQRGMLRSANLKASWKMGKIKGNGIEEMFAVLGNRKVTGDYNIAKKFLVITETNVPELKVSPEEIAQAKTVCLPLGTKYEEYEKLWGIPYKVSGPDVCTFCINNYFIKMYFDNKVMQESLKNGKIHNSLTELPVSMEGGASTGVTYMVANKKELSKVVQDISSTKKLLKKLQAKSRLSYDDSDHITLARVKIKIPYHPSSLESIPYMQLNTMLKKISESDWILMPREAIDSLKYFTWKNGRRIYATYDIIWKYLTIKYGIAYDDFKPEVIKKLKEKKATEALEGF